jgi:hypothetical protein
MHSSFFDMANAIITLITSCSIIIYEGFIGQYKIEIASSFLKMM